MKIPRTLLLSFAALLIISGCQSAYYAAWEKVGVEKREILVDRVEDAKDSQQDAQEQFSSALEHLSSLINFEGGELADIYEELNSEYEDSREAAQEVSQRIDSIEKVAQALFDEWEDELEKYESDSFRRTSAQKLRETQSRYENMINAMRKAEERMQPVLQTLQDNVLFLKHNLNASAIGALQGELTTIQGDIRGLINQMNAAIAESDAFINAMKQ